MSSSELLPLVVQFGVLGMFAAAVFEKTIPIVPSYLMLLIFGSATSTITALAAVIVVTSSGSLIGTACVYTFGRSLGEERVTQAVDKYGRFVFLPLERYRHLANAYRRNHFAVSLCGQIIPVARLYLSLPAGVLKLRADRFLVASAIGITTYNTFFLTTGFVLRGAAHDPVKTGVLLSLALVAVEIVVAGSMRWLMQRQRTAQT
ncbi:DedA family protein [Rhizobium phaseoli]|jgi:alkaline phosphatase|uniref:DedA family protein n=1 Tax=Rhizobium phaseoli TaxID=396 RepID=A0A7K3UA72_9HYPH|nr:VTT domain-containing protein [Rhizobium phaseoli]NEJ69758.1 DedA family protein [Rhizobium phaseoli]